MIIIRNQKNKIVEFNLRFEIIILKNNLETLLIQINSIKF